jgi:hypothetical protein
MRFDYYDRLGLREKETYRKSDAVTRVALTDAAALAPLLESVRIALEADDRTAVGRAVSRLAAAILQQLRVAPLVVQVLARRPSTEEAELHGLYVREDDGKAVIRLWMRTAAHGRPIRFRTFVRTLAHELLHHLDYELLKLDDSFHTEGFFRRESALVRDLIGERSAAGPRGQAPAKTRRRRGTDVQMDLF